MTWICSSSFSPRICFHSPVTWGIVEISVIQGLSSVIFYTKTLLQSASTSLLNLPCHFINMLSLCLYKFLVPRPPFLVSSDFFSFTRQKELDCLFPIQRKFHLNPSNLFKRSELSTLLIRVPLAPNERYCLFQPANFLLLLLWSIFWMCCFRLGEWTGYWLGAWKFSGLSWSATWYPLKLGELHLSGQDSVAHIIGRVTINKTWKKLVWVLFLLHVQLEKDEP